jgi:ADP-ribosylarginine hydrolase
MEGRAPGGATMNSLMLLEGILPFDGRKVTPLKWNQIPFNEKGGGCGAAMRTMCIGLRFPGEKNRDKLISVALESGRVTHNHPVAFFGAVASAVFTAYAIEGVPIIEWGKLLVKTILPKAKEYLKNNGRDWELYATKSNFDYFETSWVKYLKLRGLWEHKPTEPVFPAKFGPQERDQFYKDISFDGWGGSRYYSSELQR